MKKLNLLTIFLGLLALAITGCQSDVVSRDLAVQRARTYLLENAKDLNIEQMSYVKYNNPVLLVSDILGKRAISRDIWQLNSELKQICVTWAVPNAKKFYLVYGAANSRMSSWQPTRIICKEFDTSKYPLNDAINLARTYAISSLGKTLSAQELNLIRFSNPKVIYSKFDLTFNPDGKKSDAQIAKAKQEAQKKYQFTLVWQLNKDKMAIFCGLSPQMDMSNWQINFGGYLTNQEVAQKTIYTVLGPKEQITKVQLPKKYLKK
jgi:hypothetical protein